MTKNVFWAEIGQGFGPDGVTSHVKSKVYSTRELPRHPSIAVYNNAMLKLVTMPVATTIITLRRFACY